MRQARAAFACWLLAAGVVLAQASLPTVTIFILAAFWLVVAMVYRLGGRAKWKDTFRPRKGRGGSDWVMGSGGSSGTSSRGSSSGGSSFGGGSSGGGGASGRW